MNREACRQYADRAEAELRQNILPFWLHHVIDHEGGGFFGAITNDLQVDRAASRGALLTARILWTFSAAHRRYQDAACREMARRAYADLHERFWDNRHGGLYWSVAADGKPEQTVKHIYGQAFGVYALAEYHHATGERAALDRAISLYRVIEEHGRDPRHGGYFEAFARDWSSTGDIRLSELDLNEPKSQNTHLHVMEAYANLLRVWPDAGLQRRLVELLDVMVTRILDPGTHHLRLFLDEAWTPRSDRVSFGHDIEASWLLMEAAAVLADPKMEARLRPVALKMAQVTLNEGVDADGGLFYEADKNGVTNSNKERWPQAEAVVGFLNAYELAGGEHFLQAALRVWDFIEHRLIDRRYGEWFHHASRKGEPSLRDPKVSFWKCPYHNSRACLEFSERLRRLSAVPQD